MSEKAKGKKSPYILANFEKLYLAFTLLVGIALLLFLLDTLAIRKFKTQNLPVDLLFTQGKEEPAPNVNFKLLLNARNHKISFVSVGLYFDPQSLQLTKEISLKNSPLSRIISVTPMNEANSEGMVEIVMAQEPGTTYSQGTFELADLSFINVKGTPSEVTVVDEETQVVDNSTKDLPFTATFVTVN